MNGHVRAEDDRSNLIQGINDRLDLMDERALRLVYWAVLEMSKKCVDAGE